MDYGCDDACHKNAAPTKCNCINKVDEKLQKEFSFKKCMKQKDLPYDYDCADVSESVKECMRNPPGNTSLEFLIPFCDGDAKKAKDLGVCIKDIYDHNKPTRDDAKSFYDGICNTVRQCKSR